MTRPVIGIDPGAHGAIVVLDDAGELIELHDMPAIEETAGRPATNAPLLATVLAKTARASLSTNFVGPPADVADVVTAF